ncbi:hypothetical protein [Halosolutus halophilus]|nr:hypothetical protein [Halosolutus halophilus]
MIQPAAPLVPNEEYSHEEGVDPGSGPRMVAEGTVRVASEG